MYIFLHAMKFEWYVNNILESEILSGESRFSSVGHSYDSETLTYITEEL